MCGRFTRQTTAETIIQALQGRLELDLSDIPDAPPSWNIAPTQPLLCLLADPARKRFKLKTFRWGLIPSWAKDPAIGNKMINARAETAAEKPSYRAAMRKRRCVVIADGFYEWKKEGRGKQPWIFRLADGGLFGFAGLHERWKNPGGGELETSTILTVDANDLVRPVHDRMPAMLEIDRWGEWCDPAQEDAAKAAELLRPYPANLMESHPANKLVNSPANDGPQLAALQGDLFGA